MRFAPGIPAFTATSAVPAGAPSFAFEASIQPWTIAVALGIATAVVTASVFIARAIGDRRGPRGEDPGPTIDDEIAAALERRTIRSAGPLPEDDLDASGASQGARSR
ncbi:MAG: hypothetical protein K5924_05270 [Chloroflexi bacterium]|nr:hypothetical protein [Chloroflexota bacterium]